MDIIKLNQIIELLDNVTLDINSVEVKLMGENHDMAHKCAALWSMAYKIKIEFSNEHTRMLAEQNVAQTP